MLEFRKPRKVPKNPDKIFRLVEILEANPTVEVRHGQLRIETRRMVLFRFHGHRVSYANFGVLVIYYGIESGCNAPLFLIFNCSMVDLRDI